MPDRKTSFGLSPQLLEKKKKKKGSDGCNQISDQVAVACQFQTLACVKSGR